MNSRLALPLFPVLLVMLMVACSNQAAAEVSVGVTLGGGDRYYHRGGGVVTYRTVDPVYSTWYPDSSTTYVAPPVYYTSPYTTYPAPTYYTAPYVYVEPTPSISFGAFFGSGGHRSYDRDRGGHRR
jgi:hypothetical protein